MLSPVPSSAITLTEFQDLRDFYPSILNAVYKSKIKDVAKLASALQDDQWRYCGIVGATNSSSSRIKGKREGGGWVVKEDLERLVRWKITHGTNRPFLPSLIRQNDVSFVESVTLEAFSKHDLLNPGISNSSTEFPTEPLKILTKLKGVGPATATLILSAHDPVNIPFFEDELYAWLCGEKKLKYDIKEYRELFDGVERLRERLGRKYVKAVEVERVAYVVEHFDAVGKTIYPLALPDIVDENDVLKTTEKKGKGGMMTKKKRETGEDHTDSTNEKPKFDQASDQRNDTGKSSAKTPVRSSKRLKSNP